LVLPSELFNAGKALECIEKYKCTAVYGVPTMFVNYMNNENYSKTNRSSVKYVAGMMRMYYFANWTLQVRNYCRRRNAS